MSFAIGFALGITLGFLIFGVDWPLPDVWICIKVGKWKLEQWHLYKWKDDDWKRLW